ncbi:hypothetical protein EDD85DRAFT_938380 [Armillaria nabsnona]|nr:hypothetical protein EDD85DRAFT_938380 [Armillaria nabsnona]
MASRLGSTRTYLVTDKVSPKATSSDAQKPKSIQHAASFSEGAYIAIHLVIRYIDASPVRHLLLKKAPAPPISQYPYPSIPPVPIAAQRSVIVDVQEIDGDAPAYALFGILAILGTQLLARFMLTTPKEVHDLFDKPMFRSSLSDR